MKTVSFRDTILNFIDLHKQVFIAATIWKYHITCHGSLCHNMNICHDMKYYSCNLAKDKIQTQKFNINIKFYLMKCVDR